LSKLTRILALLAGLSAVLLSAGFINSDLPPRPTPVPTAVPPVVTIPAANGEKIQLHIENEVDEIPADLWTAVEWQDPNTGNWYVVDGWRGTLDTPTTQTWWVGSELFGDGPFRWQLYASEGGNLLATSVSFDLPARTGLMVVVNVALE